jgi:serine/threonine protein kinase
MARRKKKRFTRALALCIITVPAVGMGGFGRDITLKEGRGSVAPESGELSELAPWDPEQLLMDRYRVKECIRQSNTCQVFRVQDVFRGTYRLVLRPSPKVVTMEGWRDWFAEFCRNALSVPPHPNVVACERVTEEGGLPFLTMEDVQGRGWDSMIYDHSLSDLSQMIEISLQAAQGLAWLHRHDRVHYSVKPGNVLVCSSGVSKIWKYCEPGAKTRAYASPEQLAGGRPLTAATDVWSWAVSVLHMFVGRAAWKSGADAPNALLRYMQTGPAEPRIPLMPGSVARLLAKCFKSNPDERVVDMETIAETLEGTLTRQDAAAPSQDAAPGPAATQNADARQSQAAAE